MQEKIKKLVGQAQRILIMQADNPDADSLASSLALEQLLGEMGREVFLYCGIDMPAYLKYLPGWDRVSSDLPDRFDLSIVVDASTITLFQKLTESGKQGQVASKPCLVLDHHAETDNLIPFATVLLNDYQKSSTGELIYTVSKELGWPLDTAAAEFIMTAILGDTQGLANDLTTSETYRVMAELVELGVNRPKLEELRHALNKMPAEIFRYKGRLIERTELHCDGKIALVTIPHQEIMDYSPLYNPNSLIHGDHLQTEGVLASISLKSYVDGKVTASIRCNTAAPIASRLAEHFGGGGHTYASGFKITNGRSLDEIKSKCIAKASELIDNLSNGSSDASS